MHITVICCTYGRSRLVPEMLGCFLGQTHQDSSLLILNDQPGLRYHSTNSRVDVVNHCVRFPSLGVKREHARKLALEGNSGCFAFWDDDDLYAPNHLEEALENLFSHDACKPDWSLYSEHNGPAVRAQNLFMSSMLISRKWMQQSTFPDLSVGEDAAFLKEARINHHDICPTFISRWGMNIWHISGMGEVDQERNYRLAGRHFQDVGDIHLEPVFRDWAKMMKKPDGTWSMPPISSDRDSAAAHG